jgi:kynurenine formamidase
MAFDQRILDITSKGKVFDLGQPLENGMPVSPNHPGFKMALQRRHGDMVRTDGGSASNEMIMIGGHTGTHIDAFCHVSHEGKLYGGVDAYKAQTGGRFSQLGLETIKPFFCPGVLLDIAGYKGVDTLPPGTAITADDLRGTAKKQGTEIPRGAMVLVRSGWSRLWGDTHAYLGHDSGVPGPDLSAAHVIVESGAVATGHDSMAYEHLAPGAGHALLPVHRVMLVENGIHIIENVFMEELAAAKAYEFIFTVAALKIVGATGCPVRPIAVAL